MRSVVLALALVVGCAGPAAVVEIPVVRRPVDVAIEHTVLLSDPGCTGIRIGGGLVLTAKHCLHNRVIGDVYSGFAIVDVSPNHDFAIMSGDSAVPGVDIVPAVIGEHLYAVGYPVCFEDGEQYLTVTDGILAGPENENQQRITAPVWHGNSGGGAWNDSGELIGVIVSISVLPTGFPWPGSAYMVPARYILQALNR